MTESDSGFCVICYFFVFFLPFPCRNSCLYFVFMLLTYTHRHPQIETCLNLLNPCTRQPSILDALEIQTRYPSTSVLHDNVTRAKTSAFRGECVKSHRIHQTCFQPRSTPRDPRSVTPHCRRYRGYPSYRPSVPSFISPTHTYLSLHLRNFLGTPP